MKDPCDLGYSTITRVVSCMNGDSASSFISSGYETCRYGGHTLHAINAYQLFCHALLSVVQCLRDQCLHAQLSRGQHSCC